MAEQHRHSPLRSHDSIRLLDLLPSQDRNAVVRCTLRQISLAKARSRYDALSYVWGAREGSRPILCDGEPLLVTSNCYDAMLRLRRKCRVRTLWIDAVCIDQTSEGTKERNQQVKIMGHVYHNASTVLIWLGNQDYMCTSKDELLKGARKLLLVPCLLVILAVTIPIHSRGMEWAECFHTNYVQKRNELEQEYHRLCANPWFTRVWTVQEVAFARNIRLLTKTTQMRWDHLKRLGRDLAGKQVRRDEPYNRFRLRHDAQRLAASNDIDIDYKLYKEQQTAEIPGLIKTANRLLGNRDWTALCQRFIRSLENLDSTLPHDRVFGVYSMLGKIGIQLPDPDYSEPIEKVLQGVTKALVARFRSLDLVTSETPPSDTRGLPSWIPGYLSTTSAPTFGSEAFLRFAGTTSSASKGSEPYPQLEALSGNLMVRGKRIGTLTTVMACTQPTTHDFLDWEGCREFLGVCQRWCQFCSSLPNYVDAVEKSFPKKSLPWGDWAEVIQYPHCRDPSMTQEMSQFATTDDDDPLTVIITYLTQKVVVSNTMLLALQSQTTANTTTNWAFVMTDTGYTGRTYRTSQDLDQVWLLAGSSYPVLLRPTRNEGEFLYISPAYFSTSMDGQHWPENGKEGLSVIHLI
ncbi:hypothetical protein S40293_00043 [Stachybotrys chartarum IBT 40293]|nr:hypothetical protein S40293_00043 [Stachybotrys chartarum IBT 40293]